MALNVLFSNTILYSSHPRIDLQPLSSPLNVAAVQVGQRHHEAADVNSLLQHRNSNLHADLGHLCVTVLPAETQVERPAEGGPVKEMRTIAIDAVVGRRSCVSTASTTPQLRHHLMVLSHKFACTS